MSRNNFFKPSPPHMLFSISHTLCVLAHITASLEGCDVVWPQCCHHLLGCTFSTVTLFDSKHQGYHLVCFCLQEHTGALHLCFLCRLILRHLELNSQEARQKAVAHIWRHLHSLIADCALITNSLSYGNSGRERCLAVAIHLAHSSRNGRQVVGVSEPALWLWGIIMSAARLTR